MSTLAPPVLVEVPIKLTDSWKRWLAPSLSDFFFVAVIVWCFLAGEYGWVGLLSDGDTGLHIRIGDYILSHHTVPALDLFSYSRPGQEWYAFEWLSEVVFAFLHAAFGLKGVVLLTGIVIAATFTILLRDALWRGANSLIAMPLVLMALTATVIHFHARPHIFTLLILAILMWMIAADRRCRSAALWLAIPLTVVWTNLHGGFFLLFPILGLLAIGSLAERLLWKSQARPGMPDFMRYAMLAAGCGAASLINPYGIKLHLHILETLRAPMIMDSVAEFKSPSFRSESLFHYMVLLFLALAITGPLLRQRRLTEILWIGFLAFSSLVSVRHVPVFAVIAVPIIAVELSALWTRWVKQQSRQSVAGILDGIGRQACATRRHTSVWAFAAILTLSLSASIKWPQDFFKPAFPLELIHKHADEIASSRIFTTDQWAGYLIYRNYPKQRVFLDGRHNYYGPQIETDYLQLSGGNFNWRELMERYQFNLILCSVSSPLASLVKTDPSWRILEDDGRAVLFKKNGPG